MDGTGYRVVWVGLSVPSADELSATPLRLTHLVLLFRSIVLVGFDRCDRLYFSFFKAHSFYSSTLSLTLYFILYRYENLWL